MLLNVNFGVTFNIRSCIDTNTAGFTLAYGFMSLLLENILSFFLQQSASTYKIMQFKHLNNIYIIYLLL